MIVRIERQRDKRSLLQMLESLSVFIKVHQNTDIIFCHYEVIWKRGITQSNMKHFLNITCIYFELLQCFHPGTMKQSKQILHMHITIEIWKDVL